MLTCSLGVHHPLWDPLPVEVGHLIQIDEVLQQRWAAWTRRLDVQLVADWRPGSRGQHIRVLETQRRKSVIVAPMQSLVPLVQKGRPNCTYQSLILIDMHLCITRIDLVSQLRSVFEQNTSFIEMNFLPQHDFFNGSCAPGRESSKAA